MQNPEPIDEAGRRAVLLRNLDKLLGRLNADEKQESRLAAVANSPFVVTLIGGLLVALIAWGLQTMTNRHENRKLADKLVLENKEKLAYDFASSFPLSLDLGMRFRERHLWLEQQQQKETQDKFRDGRSFEETRKYYESSLDQYLSRSPVASACNQIIMSFTNQNAKQLASDLDSHFKMLLQATNDTQLDSAFSNSDQIYQALTLEMFKELLTPK